MFGMSARPGVTRPAAAAITMLLASSALWLGAQMAVSVATVTGARTPVRAAERAPAANVARALAQSGASECVPHAVKVAAPDEVTLGEQVSITLHARAECPDPPLHLVLVLQGSASIAGSVHRQIELAARETVDSLDLSDNPGVRIGVVGFNDRARRYCELTNDDGRLLSCINQLGQTGGVALDSGIDEGVRVLRRGRADVNPHMLTEVMVVMTDGRNDTGCGPVQAAAGQAKREGVLALSVCAGADCDSQCVRQIASSPRYYFDSLSDYVEALRQFPEQVLLVSSQLRGLAITDTLQRWMRYVPGSAAPAPESVSVDGDVLTWRDEYLPVWGMSVTLAAVPTELGYLATNLSATGTLTDAWGLTTTFEFDVPWVTVRDADGTPGTPGTPPPSPQAIHAALVLDGSASMAGESLVRMQDGALGFVAYLAPSENLERRVSVTEFASAIERHCDLTNVTGHAVRCIREVDAGGSSRIDLGVADGLAALREGRHIAPAGAREAIVMLTDGGHASGCEPITRIADEAKAEGVSVFTICLGTGCDSQCMRQVGSGAGYSYDTDDPADLPAIYVDIARKLVEGLPPTPGPSPTVSSTPVPTVAASETPVAVTVTPTSISSTATPTFATPSPTVRLLLPLCSAGDG